MTDPFADAPGTGYLADADPAIAGQEDTGSISDGFHTFDELYAHRAALTAVLATIAAIDGDSWRSKQHHPGDKPMYDGYFVVGIDLPDGQISYHYPLADWDLFAAVPELEHAPRWDGHSPADTVTRLHAFTRHLHAAIQVGRGLREVAREAADEMQQGVAFYDRHAVGVVCCQTDESGGTDE